MDARIVLAVALGGALGSLARYGAGLTLEHGELPWSTIAVNVVGSFALGFIVFNPGLEHALGREARMFLTVGFLGGFTTMSAFASEFTGFAAAGNGARAAAVFLLNAAGSVLAAVGGRAAGLAWG